ncbi:MAG TPA: hypothetical protein VHZ96_04170 [Frankiaceae bacterium]|jgi:hypothetical protein|nr:hypothetical protein [Frankiaceae bacterium]
MTAPGNEPPDAQPDPGFGVPPGAPQTRRWTPEAPHSRDVLSALVVAISLVVVGVPMGIIWAATTPKLNVKQALAGSEAAFNAQGGADVHFAFLALIFGVLAGAVVGWRGRRGSWTLPVALAVGGVGGSLVAAQVGHLRGSSRVLDQLPQDIRGRVSNVVDFVLRSHGFHVVFPVAALLTYLIIMLLTTSHQEPVLPEAPEPERYWSVPR